ncbi:MAG: hypothetical protein EA362_11200 [Saprospirales bacterium]|nr:MAG: hypothetical protein EA362_11200 [Saprospirales bacterium]
MIPGKCTNFIYFSSLLQTDIRFKETCNCLLDILRKNKVKFDFIGEAWDIWCRDYMPVQLEVGRFVQFRYEPSYLEDYPDLRINAIQLHKPLNIAPQISSINLDGGNIISWSDKAIVSSRVFDENPQYSNSNKLISEIEKLLEVEVIIIPQIDSDMTGHVDGMLRFVDGNTLVGNDRSLELGYWRRKMKKILRENGLNYIDFPFFEYEDKRYADNAIGCYVNYLEVDDLIVFPIFETVNNKDNETFDLLREIFPDRIIESLNFNDVGYLGGLLNCASWTIKV